jgi:tyrosyl-tRNA synthetase
MQGYDFLVLYNKYGTKLQMGGDDQWSNILAGADLIRRKERGEAFGLTFSLLLTSDGKKMGKTEKGALWLDPEKTTPYEFYQYFRNVDDSDVENCLKLLTFASLDEIAQLCKYRDERINEAKKRLALEITAHVHGQDAAMSAAQASSALFEGGAESGSIPATALTREQINENIKLMDLMVKLNLAKSKGDARRLIVGGGVCINDNKISDEFYSLPEELINAGSFIIRKGKKVYHKVEINA